MIFLGRRNQRKKTFYPNMQQHYFVRKRGSAVPEHLPVGTTVLAHPSYAGYAIVVEPGLSPYLKLRKNVLSLDDILRVSERADQVIHRTPIGKRADRKGLSQRDKYRRTARKTTRY